MIHGHDFSVETPHVRFCSRCARPDITRTRRAPCVRVTDVAEVLKRRLQMLALLLDAHTRQSMGKRIMDKPIKRKRKK